jgi:Cu+-exporting ATPase
LECIAFDKTGTLTKGIVSLKNIVSLDPNFLPLLLGLQQSSKHPIAKAVINYCKQIQQDRDFQSFAINDVNTIHGQGIQGTYDGHPIIAGNAQMLASFDININTQVSLKSLNIDPTDNTIYVAYKGNLIGYFSIEDQIRPESKQAIERLHQLGLSTVILSGDKQNIVQVMSEKLGVNTFYAQQTPQQKLQQLSKLQQNGMVAMVGDGVNDAPALAAADVSIAMGGGSDAAKQTAAMTLMRDDPRLIAIAIKLSRATWKTIQQNLFWAFIFNSLAIPAAAFGYLTPTIAAMAMTASSLIVLTNSLLLKRTRLK